MVVFDEQRNSFVIQKNMIYMFSMDYSNIPEQLTLTWIYEIQNGETHGRLKLIESTPSCRKILSSKVWVSFSLISI
jgi:hypothetical protein